MTESFTLDGREYTGNPLILAGKMLEIFRGNPKYVAYCKPGGTFRPHPLSSPLPEGKLLDHFGTDFRVCLGFYLLEGKKAHVSCVDFDDHGRNDGAIMDARTVMAFLTEMGHKPLLEISQSGEGAHVWLLHPDMEAATVRLFWKGALQQCQVTAEIYPKQDDSAATTEGLGNLIRYPLHNHSRFEDVSGTVLDPLPLLTTWEPISAYDIRTKGEYWYTATEQQTRAAKFQTEGLPDSVRELIESDELLARRWAGDVAGLGDPSRSSVVIAMALDLVRRYVPTPEIKAALTYWCEKENYAKSEAWIDTTMAKAYGYIKGRPANKDAANKGGQLAAVVYGTIDRMAAGMEMNFPSSLPFVDKAIGGARFGELVVVGCRTSNGKSAIAIQWAHAMAHQGFGACIVPLEMGEDEMGLRIMSHLGIDEDTPTEEAKRRVDQFYRTKAPVHLSSPVYKINDLVEHIRYQHSLGYRVFVIDHMGKLKAPGKSSEYETFSECYRELSILTKELKILTICCQQRNRKADQDGEDPNPKLDSLHGGGAIEQDADIIIIGRHIWRENPSPGNEYRYVGHLMKARNHRIKQTITECVYNTDTQTFEEIE